MLENVCNETDTVPVGKLLYLDITVTFSCLIKSPLPKIFGPSGRDNRRKKGGFRTEGGGQNDQKTPKKRHIFAIFEKTVVGMTIISFS